MSRISIAFSISMLFIINAAASGFTSMPFPVGIKDNNTECTFDDSYMAKMSISGDTIAICTVDGVFKKNIYDKEWGSTYLYPSNVIQYLELDDEVIELIYDNNESPIFKINKKNGEHKWPKLSDESIGRLSWIAQDPYNKRKLLVIESLRQYCLQSDDFGDTWYRPEKYYLGAVMPTMCFEYNPFYESEFFLVYYIPNHKEAYWWRYNKNSTNPSTGKFNDLSKCNSDYHDELNYSHIIRNCTFDNRKDRVWVAGDGILAVHTENPDCYHNESYYENKYETTYFPDYDRTNTYFVRILLDETDPNIAYAPGVEKEDDKTSLVIYKSTDSGINWSKIASEELTDSRSRLLDNVMYDNKILMYLNGNRLIEFDLNSVAGIADDIVPTDDSGAEYYNLQGIKVENPKHGIHIKKQGNKSEKIVM